MKVVSVLVMISLSASAYGNFVFDSHAAGTHTLQGLGTWQDVDGAKGSYLVQLQLQHLAADQALISATYMVQNKTYNMGAVVVQSKTNSNFFEVLSEGVKTGEGYCLPYPTADAKGKFCKIACEHNNIKFDGSLVANNGKVERLGSMILPSGRKIVLRDSLTLVPSSSSVMGLERRTLPAADPFADDFEPQDMQMQGPNQGQGQVAQQGPVAQGRVDQGPLASKGGKQQPQGKPAPGAGVGGDDDNGDDDNGDDDDTAGENRRAPLGAGDRRSAERRTISASEGEQIRHQIIRQQEYLRRNAR